MADDPREQRDPGAEPSGPDETPEPQGQGGDVTPGAEDASKGGPAAVGDDGGDGRDGGDGGRRAALMDIRIPRGWLLGMLVALVVVLIVATVGFSVANNDNTCGWCHVIKKEVTAFKASEHYHKGVHCQACHTKPGVFNYFIRNLQASTHIIEYVSGRYQRPITTYVGASNCVQCHPKEQIEKDIIVGDIRVNHTGLRDAGFQCVTCHSELAHGKVIPVGSRPPKSLMAICTTCHNGVTQPRRCAICHVNGVPAGTAQVTMPVHMDEGNCRECHSKAFCAKCHNGLTMPHPVGWRQQHGPVVIERGKQICVSCHTKKDPTFCIDCHGVQMPHPADWETTHAAKATSDPQVCVKCHGTNSCIKCHGLQMPHPSNWLATHPTTAKSDPALCNKCHTSSFCTACHGVALPHSAAFIASHPTYAATHGTLCQKCHGNEGSGPSSCYGGDCHTPGSPPH